MKNYGILLRVANRRMVVNILDDFCRFYKSKLYTDFTLRASNDLDEVLELKVHKFVLAARSPVFEAMLNSGMSESTTGEVEIKLENIDNLDRFLDFLYKGNISSCSDEDLVELITLGDIYEVKGIFPFVIKTLQSRSISHEDFWSLFSKIIEYLWRIER